MCITNGDGSHLFFDSDTVAGITMLPRGGVEMLIIEVAAKLCGISHRALRRVSLMDTVCIFLEEEGTCLKKG